MIGMSIDLSNVIDQLDKLMNDLPETVDQAMQECGQLVIQEESKNTKGKLSESFYTYKDGDQQIIDTDKAYAQYVEYGRGPVRAINAKALRFIINGEVIFRKSVGPMAAQPFVRQSLTSASTSFTNIFDKHIKRLIK